MKYNIQIKKYDIIDSTNSEAKRLIQDIRPDFPLLLIAKEQTAGRGRQGKSFYSPADTGLYMTLAVPMGCHIAGQVSITTKVAVAVNKALENNFPGKKFFIKWVNDIYLNNKKCCGILCEAINDYEKDILEYAVIGVGVNISTANWSDELSDIATSLLENDTDSDFSFDIDILAESISASILNELKDDDYINYYKEHSMVIGNEIVYIINDEKRSGMAVDIDNEGGLIVKTDSDNLIHLNSGEISLRLK